MPSSLIHDVANYCWSHKFLDVFHKFFRDYAEEFIDAPEMQSGEHDLKYDALFRKYLSIYEETLETYLKTLDVSIEDFYAEVRQVKEDGDDPFLNTFVRCLLASADYESFYKVMYKEGKKKALELKSGPSVSISTGADAKPEAKSERDSAKALSNEAEEEDEDFKSEGKSGYK